MRPTLVGTRVPLPSPPVPPSLSSCCLECFARRLTAGAAACESQIAPLLVTSKSLVKRPLRRCSEAGLIRANIASPNCLFAQIGGQWSTATKAARGALNRPGFQHKGSTGSTDTFDSGKLQLCLIAELVVKNQPQKTATDPVWHGRGQWLAEEMLGCDCCLQWSSTACLPLRPPNSCSFRLAGRGGETVFANIHRGSLLKSFGHCQLLLAQQSWF